MHPQELQSLERFLRGGLPDVGNTLKGHCLDIQGAEDGFFVN